MKKKIIFIAVLTVLMLTVFISAGCSSGQGDTEVEKPRSTANETNREGKEEEQKPKEQEEETEPEETGRMAAPSVTGALHVEGTQLAGEDGEPVQLRGISTHGMAWFPDYINEACFTQLHEEWKANLIRLAMYTAESGGYCTDGDREYLKGLIREGVKYASNQDMYAIIDWHILSDSNPNTYLQEAKEFFGEMSAEYADAHNILYEICNEPNGNTSWSDIKAYAQEVIPVIRANDEDAVIIVGTPNWSQFVDQAAADPITGYENIMYTLHFYAATHKDDLRNKMAVAIDSGLPVFVTEYGICDASGNGAIDEAQADEWVEMMNRYGVSYAAWNLSNKEESSAILQSTCGKTSGFVQDDLSQSGQWLINMLKAGYLRDTQTQETTDGGRAQEGSEGRTGEDKTEDESKDTKGNENAQGNKTGNQSQGEEVRISGEDTEITAFVKNQWEEDGVPVCQYELTVRNISGKDLTQWSADISFQDVITLKDGWNGEYSAQENILHITSKEYNGSIPKGGSVGDVGFIISGGNGIRQ